MPLASGTQLGAYVITARIGAGAWCSTDRLDRDFPPTTADSHAFLQMAELLGA